MQYLHTTIKILDIIHHPVFYLKQNEDNVQNISCYIDIPSSQTYRYCIIRILLMLYCIYPRFFLSS
jgi:hypothetical protein